MPRHRRKNKNAAKQHMVQVQMMEELSVAHGVTEDGKGGKQLAVTTTKTMYSLQGVIAHNKKAGVHMKILTTSDGVTDDMKAQAHAVMAAASTVYPNGGNIVAVQISEGSPPSITTSWKDGKGGGAGTDSSGIGGSGGTTPTCSPTPHCANWGNGNEAKIQNVTVSTTKDGKALEASSKLAQQSHPRRDSNECTCCGGLLPSESDYEDDYFSDSESDSEGDCTTDDSDLTEKALTASERDRDRMNILLMQNAKTKVIMKKNIQLYAKIAATQNMIRDQQVMVIQRANSLNTMYVRNMESIMKLGFCPLRLQDRTDNLSRGIIDVHKLIGKWDERLEELMPVPKITKGKFLPSLLEVFKELYGTDIESMTNAEFEEALKTSVEHIPDEDSIKAVLDNMDLMEIEMEWEIFEHQAETHLHKLEVEFIEFCVECGLRIRLPDVPGYEWAHAEGPEPVRPRRCVDSGTSSSRLKGAQKNFS